MLKRSLTALIGIPAFLILCIWGPVPFTIGMTITAAIGVGEVIASYRANGTRPNVVLSGLGLLGPISPLVLQSPVTWLHIEPLGVFQAALVAFFGALVWELYYVVATGKLEVGRRVSYGILCGAYTALFGGVTILRAVTPITAHVYVPYLQPGAALVLLVAFAVWVEDSSALFVGSKWGTIKLAPLLSPKKTLQGAVGALVGALLAGVIFGWVFFRAPLVGLAVGAIAGIFGQLGDLFKSALKREIGVKDFGNVFPGHGGVFDRFDSLLFVAPMVAMLMSWIHASWLR